jgi:hypothetical protein
MRRHGAMARKGLTTREVKSVGYQDKNVESG